MLASIVRPHRTRFYIDGYNLYFGCLKRSPHKWLNVLELCRRVLQGVLVKNQGVALQFQIDPLGVKYFTSSILPSFARSPDSIECQKCYEDALRVHLGSAIQIVKGYYDAKCARAYRYIEGEKPLSCELLEIWKLEEKQTDVALSLHAYKDAVSGEVDHVVFVTNDTDVAPALEMIRNDTKVVVGHIVPSREPTDPKHRRANSALSNLAHWTRGYLREDELAASQLPANIHHAPPINKPVSWYPRPDLLQPIFDEAKKVRGSGNRAWKWLNAESPRLGNRRPIDMAATDDEAAKLRAYMKDYSEQMAQIEKTQVEQ